MSSGIEVRVTPGLLHPLSGVSCVSWSPIRSRSLFVSFASFAGTRSARERADPHQSCPRITRIRRIGKPRRTNHGFITTKQTKDTKSNAGMRVADSVGQRPDRRSKWRDELRVVRDRSPSDSWTAPSSFACFVCFVVTNPFPILVRQSRIIHGHSERARAR